MLAGERQGACRRKMITKYNKITVINGIRYVGQGLRFERIRRITGYLVGTLDRFNNAKRAEESERVKHVNCGCLRDS